jgi:hypothetical protein
MVLCSYRSWQYLDFRSLTLTFDVELLTVVSDLLSEAQQADGAPDRLSGAELVLSLEGSQDLRALFVDVHGHA